MNWKKRYRKLEDRVLLDAAGAVTVADSADSGSDKDTIEQSPSEEHHREQENITSLVAALGETDQDSTAAPVTDGPEILFVDSQVEDVDQLLAHLSADVEVHYIDSDVDGVEYIADVLSNSGKTYSAMHIISHGDAGELRLGNSTLTEATLYGDTLSHVQSWGDSLSETGDILIYGCSVAEGDQGISFVERMAEITGADIAASSDDTGAALEGGDWDLEVTAGDVEADVAISASSQQSWGNLLALSVESRDDISADNGGGAAGDDAADQEIAEALSPPGSGVIFSSVNYQGDPESIARFEDLQTSFNSGNLMDRGVVISTGLVDSLIGDGTNDPLKEGNTTAFKASDDLTGGTISDTDDAELDASAAGDGIDFNQFDVSVFEFSFVTDPGVTKVALTYVFSTEETDTYSASGFADLFGVYLRNDTLGTSYDEFIFSNLDALHNTEDAFGNNIEVDGVTLLENDDTDPNTEQNWVTTLGDTLLILPGDPQNDTYTVKFAIADQGDGSLNSAAFFDWIGSAIRLDIDANDDSGATGVDYNTEFDVSVGDAQKIVDVGDVSLTNYDNTDITSVTVNLTNAFGTDTLTIDDSLYPNITSSAASSTSLTLTWSGSSATNISDIVTALEGIEYSNSDGLASATATRAIEIVANDGETNSSIATAFVDIVGFMDAPTVDSQVATTLQPTITGSFDEADSDTLVIVVDGQTYTWVNVRSGGTPPAGLSSDGSGNWSLDLSAVSPSQSLADGVTYNVSVTSISAGGSLSDASTNEVTVNLAATFAAVDDSLSIGEDGPAANVAVSGVLQNDLGATSVTAVTGGSVGSPVTGSGGGEFTINANGSYTYDPNGQFENLVEGQTATDSITYTASDGSATATATLTVTITGTNDAPIITGDLAATIDEGTSYTLLPADLGYSDPDDLDAGVSFTVDSVLNGLIQVGGVDAFSFTATQLTNGDVSFVHDGSETTTATFGVSVEDGNEDASVPVSSLFTFTVNLVDDVPVASNDSVTTDEETVFNGNVPAANDPDGPPIDAAGFALVDDVPPGSGTLTFNNDGSYSFDPGSDFDELEIGDTEDVTFTYTASNTSAVVSAPATITITVTGTDDPPPAEDNAITVAEDGPATSLGLPVLSSVETSETLTITVAQVPTVSQGEITIGMGGAVVGATDVLTPAQLNQLVFTPTANFEGIADSFIYEVSDGTPGDEATGTVTIDVSPGNDDAPVAEDGGLTVLSDSTDTNLGLSVPVSQDLGETLTITVDQVPTVGQGEITIGPGGATVSVSDTLTPAELAQLVFTPAPGFEGSAASFVYTLSDGTGADDDTGTVTLQVNAGLTAQDDTLTVSEDDTAVTVPADGVLTNDFNAPSLVTANLTLNFDAAQDSPTGDGTWEDQQGSGYQWDYAGSGVTFNSSPASDYPGITGFYSFDGTDVTGALFETGGGAGESFDNLPGNPSDADATFEIWFRASSDSDQDVLFESGAGGDGISLSLDRSGASTNGFLDFKVKDGGADTQIQVDLDGLGIDPTTEFIQVVGVVDLGSATGVRLYVNGQLEATGDATSLSDWAGGNEASLGGFDGINFPSGGAFEGDIAQFRLYETAFADPDVQQNFDHITQSLTVTEANGSAVPDPAGGPPTSVTVTGTAGGEFTVFSDGSYTYNPNGITAGLFDSLAIGDAPATDSITYTVEDALGDISTATLTVSITPANDAPELNLGPAATVDEGDSYVLTPTDIGYTDIDDINAGITFSISNEVDGQIQVSGSPASSFTPSQLAAGLVTFVHDGSEATPASFDVSVEDGNEDGSAPVAETFTLTVNPLDDPPESVASSVSGAEDGGDITVQLTGVDTDGDVVSFRILSLPVGGTLYADAGKTIPVAVNDVISATITGPFDSEIAELFFEPNTDFNGVTTVEFAAIDNTGNQDATPALATITVTSVPDDPEFVGDGDAPGDPDNVDTYDFGAVQIGTLDGAAVGTVFAEDGDAGSLPLTYQFSGGGLTDDIFTLNATTGVITVNQDIVEADIGSYTLTVEVVQDGSVEDSATVSIEVSGFEANPDTGVTGEDSPLNITDPASGLLSNDLTINPGITTSLLYANFDAANPPVGGTVWDDENDSPLTQFNLGGTGVTYDSAVDSEITTIEAAYDFSSATSPLVTTGSFPENITELSATFELWAKFDTPLTNGQDYVLLDMADGDGSFSLVYRAGPTPEDGSFFVYVDDDDNANEITLELDLNGEIDPTADFMQIALRIVDADAASTISLLVNGGTANGGLQSSVDVDTPEFPASFDDWGQQVAIALGGVSGTQGGPASGVTTNDFSGQIASFRVYEDNGAGGTGNLSLDDSQLSTNYQALIKPYVSAVAGVDPIDGSSSLTGTVDAPTTLTLGSGLDSTAVQGSAGGLFTIFSDGTYSYDPEGGFDPDVFDPLQIGDTPPTDSVTYTITAADGSTSTSTLTVTVTPVNDAPVIDDQTLQYDENLEDGDLVGTVVATDIDNDLADLSFSFVATGTNTSADGFFEIDNDGNITITAAGIVEAQNDFETTPNSFDYDIEVSDGFLTDTATVTLEVLDVNDPPEATDNTVTVDEDQVYAFDSADFTFTDVETDALVSITIDAAPSGSGVLEYNGGAITFPITVTAANIGLLTFTPAANDNGTGYAAFDFTVNDADLGEVAATLTIDVDPVTDLTAADDTLTVDEDSVANPGDVSTNDSTLSGGTLTYAVDTDVSNGTLNLNGDGTYTYTPDANFNGTDSFTYVVTDADSGESLTQTVTITVDPVTDLTAADDTLTVDEDSVANPGDVSTNDSTLSGGTLTYAVDTDVSNGTLNLNGDGTYTYTPDANFNGTDSFTYVVTDADSGESLTQTVTITVDPVTDLTAADDTLTVDEDSVANPGDVSTNDSTLSGGTLTYAVDTDVSNGTLNLNGDGTYTYTPDANFNGTDSFTYVVTDADSGESLTQTVTITVDPVTDLTAADDTLTVDEDSVANPGDVSTNDSTLSGGTLTYAVDTDVSNGTLNLNGDGTYTYTPDANFNGTDSFTYVVTDADSGESLTQTVTITVDPVTDLTAADDTLTVDEDSVANPGDVSTNDSTLSGGTLTYAVDTDVSNGTLNLNGDGTYTYTPDANFNGTDSFTYVVTDADSGESLTQTVTITVDPVTDLTAADDTLTVDEDSVANPGDVSTNDSTLSGGTLTYAVDTDVSNGTLNLNGDGTYTYTPDANFNGTDSFTYVVTDADSGESLTQTVTITVDPVTDLTAADDTLTVDEDSVANPGDVSTNDSTLSGGTLTYAVDTDVSNGTLNLNGDGTYTYTPDANFNGTDSFTYVVTDADSGESLTQTVTITVDPVTDLTAADDTLTVDEDSVANPGDVSTNDSTLSGGTLTYAVDTDVSNGTLNLNGDGTYTYTPDANFNGTDSFTYVVTDADSGESLTQTVTITVDPVTDLTAADDTLTVDEDSVANPGDVSTNDSTLSGGTLTYAVDTDVSNGTLNLNGDGTYTYTPDANFNGTDSFTYVVTDADSGESLTQTVTITVDPVTDLTAADDTLTVDEDSVANPGDVSTNDSTLSGGTLTYAVDTDVSNGTLNLNGDGTYTYTPDANFNGTDSFTYVVTDADSGESLTQTVTITVDPVTDLTAADDTLTVDEDSVANPGDVSTNDSTLSGGTLTYAVDTDVSNGTLNLNGDGTYTYTPDANFNGTDSFTYVVTDADSGESLTQTVTITVDPVTDLTAADDTLTVDEDSVANPGDVSTNDSTLSGGTLTYAVDTDVSNGTLNLNGDGTYTYTPDANFNGTDSFTYVVTDADSGESLTQTVTITVDPVTDLTAADDTLTVDEDSVANPGDVSTNDSTLSGGTLTYAVDTDVSNGTLNLNGDGTYTYTPDANFNGTDSFTYVVTDADSGESLTQTVTITVDPVTDLTAADDTLTVDEDSVANPGDVSTNDSTLSGGTLTYAVDTDVSNGTLNLNGDGTYTYTPDANFNGTDSFTYVVTDADSGESLTQTVTITVDPVTDLTAADDTLTVDEDSVANPGDVSTNDSTLSGGTLTYAVDTDVSNGTLNLNGDGTYTYTPDANFNGTDSFTYVVTDADSGESLTQTVTITVDPVTDLTAADDTLTVDEDSVANPGDVSTNDSTLSGGTLTYAVDTDVSNGTLNLNGDGTYTYTPDANFNGTDSFTYVVTDADSGESLTQTVTITVDPVTDLTAADDTLTVDEDSVANPGDVSTNDSTLSGGTLTYAVDTDVSNGTLNLNGDGTYTYTPDANFNGTDSFTYVVTDADSGESLTQTVTITVDPVTDLTAADDTLTVDEDSVANPGDVSTNDSTLSGGTLTYAVDTDVSNGTLNLNGDGTYTYTPDANFNGTDSFTYVVTDADSGESLTQTVTITVDPVTDLTAADDTLTVDEDSVANPGDVSTNDSTLSGGTLTYAVDTDVSNGTLNLNGDGTYTYTPDANFNGTDSFTYVVTDADSGESLTQTVTITVDPVTDLTAADDTLTVDEDSVANPGDVSTNDSTLSGGTLTYAVDTDVSNGTLNLNGDGTYTYTPDANFNGTDSFTYVVTDADSGESLTQTVTITVDPVTDLTAADDTLTVDEDSVANPGDVSTNDSTLSGGTLTYAVDTDVSNGTLNLNGDGTYTYTPDANFNGTDSFTYVVTDADSGESLTQTVTITVDPVTDLTAADDTLTVDEDSVANPGDVSTNDSTLSGGTLTYAVDTDVSNGTLNLNGDGTYTYTPDANFNGTDSFTYVVTDADSGESLTQTVTITVDPVTDLTAADDTLTVDEDSVANPGDVSTNDSTLSGGTLTYAVDTDVSNGTLNLNGDGTYTYTPDANFNGTDSFTYVVTDADSGESLTQTVTITVDPVTDLTAADDTLTVDEDSVANPGDVSTNDSTLSGGTLTYAVDTDVSNGTLNLNGDGTYTYTPDANFNGTDSFTYVVTDADSGESLTQTVTITVDPVTDLTAADDTLTVDEDSVANPGDVSTNDSTLSGGTLTYAVDTDVSNGTLNLNGDGTYTYTPDANFNGTDSFTYVVTDADSGESLTQTVTITVDPVTDLTAADDTLTVDEDSVANPGDVSTNDSTLSGGTLTYAVDTDVSNGTLNLNGDGTYTYTPDANFNGTDSFTYVVTDADSGESLTQTVTITVDPVTDLTAADDTLTVDEDSVANPGDVSTNDSTLSGGTLTYAVDTDVSNGTLNLNGDGTYTYTPDANFNGTDSFTYVVTDADSGESLTQTVTITVDPVTDLTAADDTLTVDEDSVANPGDVSTNDSTLSGGTLTYAVDTDVSNGTLNLNGDGTYTYTPDANFNGTDSFTYVVTDADSGESLTQTVTITVDPVTDLTAADDTLTVDEDSVANPGDVSTNDSTLSGGTLTYAVDTDVSNGTLNLNGDGTYTYTPDANFNGTDSFTYVVTDADSGESLTQTVTITVDPVTDLTAADDTLTVDEDSVANPGDVSTNDSTLSGGTLTYAVDTDVSNGTLNLNGDGTYTYTPDANFNGTDSFTYVVTDADSGESLTQTVTITVDPVTDLTAADDTLTVDEDSVANPGDVSTNDSTLSGGTLTYAVDTDVSNGTLNLNGDGTYTYTPDANFNGTDSFTYVVTDADSGESLTQTVTITVDPVTDLTAADDTLTVDEDSVANPGDVSTNDSTLSGGTLTYAVDTDVSNGTLNLNGDGTYTYTPDANFNGTDSFTYVVTDADSGESLTQTVTITVDPVTDLTAADDTLTVDEDSVANPGDVSTNDSTLSGGTLTYAVDTDVSNGTLNLNGDGTYTYTPDANFNGTDSFTYVVTDADSGESLTQTVTITVDPVTDLTAADDTLTVDEDSVANPGDVSTNDSTLSGGTLTYAVDTDVSNGTLNLNGDGTYTYTPDANFNGTDSFTYVVTDADSGESLTQTVTITVDPVTDLTAADDTLTVDEDSVANPGDVSTNDSTLSGGTLTYAVDTDVSNGTLNLNGDGTYTYTPDANFNGTDSFTYVVTDADSGESLTQTVTITVDPVTDLTAADDTLTVDEDSVANPGDVSTNDSTLSGGTLTYAVDTDVSNGTLNLNGDGTYTYTPDANFNGTDSFTYVVTDADSGESLTQTVTITVDPVTDLTAADDTLTVDEDSVANPGDVSTNDSTLSGGTLTYAVDTDVSNGTLNLNGDGTYTYTPDANFNGTDSFTYVVTDADSGESLTQTVTITVDPVTDLTAADDTLTVDEDSVANPGDVSTNDSTLSGGTLTYAVDTDVSNGTLNLNGDGTYTYTPDANFNGTDSFTYVVTDADSGESLTQTVTITVDPVTDLTAADDTLTVDEDSVANPGDVSTNDSTLSGGTLTYAVDTDVSNGTLNLNGDGTYTYTPDANFNGTDSFTYVVTDADSGESLTQTVTITVDPVTDLTAADDTLTVDEDSVANPGDVSTNDSTLSGGTLTYAVDTDVSNGTLNLNGDGTYTYTPDANFNGTDSFTYVVTDADSGESLTQTVTITVDPVTDLTAADDTLTVDEDSVANPGDVSTNDSTLSGGTLTYAVDTDVSNGTLNLNGDGTYTYTPDANFNGTDSFTYVVTDADSGESLTQTVTITVDPVTDLTAADDTLTVDEDSVANPGDVSTNDSTLSGGTLTYAVDTDVSNGTLNLNGDGTYTYTPDANFNGTDSFTYVVTDADSGESLTQTVTITVDPVTDLTAADDTLTVDEDSVANPGDVSTNDSTLSGGTLTYAVDTDVSNGTLNLNGDGTYTYTPDANFNGTDSFTYVVTDADSGESLTQTVTITVDPVTDLTAADDTLTVDEDSVANPGDVSTNDSTLSGGTLTYAVDTDVSNGTLNLNGDGTYTYTPDANFNGTDSFTYVVTDADSGESLTQTVTITVDPVTDLTAADDTLTVDEDSVANPGDVSTNDSTLSGGTLTYAVDTDVSNGTLNLNGDGTYTYTPDANFNGTDSFTYVVTDADSGESLTQTVTITVDPVTDLTAADDTLTVDEDSVANPGDVSTNDSTLSGGTLTYAVDTDVSNGTLNLNGDGTYTYTPDANFNGTDSFTYVVTDADSGESLTQTVTITVDPVTDLTAADDTLTVDEDSVANPGDVSTNDSTLSGGTLTYAVDTDVSNGTLNLNGDGTYTYTPDANFNGTDSFTYVVTDADSGESLTQTVTITVDPVTDLTAADDTLTVDEDSVANPGDVSTNDSTLSGGTLTYAVDTDVSNGTLNLNGDGTYTYTPDANFNGTDSFTYVVTDADSGESLTQTVTITVDPVTDLTAADDTLTVDEDSVANPGDVSTNDSTLSGGTLTYAVDTDVSNGTLNLNGDGTYTYTPDANFNGTDSFTYVVTDADSGESLTQTVTITVDPVTDLTAADDTLTVDEDSVANPGDVSTNDSTLSGGTLTYAVDTDVSNGTLNLNGDGTYTYTPDANFNGTDSFTYVVTDADSGESLTQTVTITVDPVTDLTAADDTLTVDEDSVANPGDVSTNDSTLSGGTLTYAVDTDVSNGTLNLNGDGTYTYTPDANFNGTDSFTYVVTDADSGESLTQTVTITVDPVTDLTAADDTLTVDEDSVANPGDVSTNDSTLSGGTLTYAVDTDVSNGTLNLNGDGTYTYTPDANFNGTDSFTYVVTDADSGESLTQTVTITVDPVTDLTAADDTLTVDEDSVANPGDVSTNDSTLSGGTLTYAVDTDVSNGTLNLNGDGTYTYTPDANFNGTDSFTYVVTDADSGESLTQTVTITVDPVTDLTAADDTLTVDEDSVANPGDVSTNDSTLSGGTLTYAVDTDVSNGTLNLNGDGTYTYTPDANFNGTDSFTYVVTDADSGESLTQTVTITVDPVTDLTAADDTLTVDEDSVANPGDVSTNDSTLSGGTLTYAVDTDVSNGTLNLNGDGTYTYTPDANFNGTDSFTYVVTDADSGESLTQTVTITVDPVTDLTAADDTLTVDEDSVANPGDVSTNDSTLSGGTLTYAVDTDVSNGTLNLNGDGTYTYTPDANFNGTDSFTYVVTDADSGESLTQTVTITVDPVTDLTAADDTLRSTKTVLRTQAMCRRMTVRCRVAR